MTDGRTQTPLRVPPSFQDFCREVERQRVTHRWRWGQTVFNVLHDVDPGYANLIRGGDLDPFYLDDRVPRLLAVLEAKWDE